MLHNARRSKRAACPERSENYRRPLSYPKDGETALTVAVHLLKRSEETDAFAEQGQRSKIWVSPAAAAVMVMNLNCARSLRPSSTDGLGVTRSGRASGVRKPGFVHVREITRAAEHLRCLKMTGPQTLGTIAVVHKPSRRNPKGDKFKDPPRRERSPSTALSQLVEGSPQLEPYPVGQLIDPCCVPAVSKRNSCRVDHASTYLYG